MRIVNLLSFAVVVALAVLTAQIIETKMILPSFPYGEMLDPLKDSEVNVIRYALDFWGPIIAYATNLINLVVPTGVAIGMLLYGERKFFSKQASKGMQGFIPLVVLSAVVLSFCNYDRQTEWYVIGGMIAVVALYILAYQIVETVKVYRASRKVSAPVAQQLA